MRHAITDTHPSLFLSLPLSLQVGMIAVMCAIACCKTARRTYPLNYFLLALFTLFST